MAAAVSEQEESLRSEKQVLGELKKAEADTMTFELQVLTQDVQGLQHQVRTTQASGAGAGAGHVASPLDPMYIYEEGACMCVVLTLHCPLAA